MNKQEKQTFLNSPWGKNTGIDYYIDFKYSETKYEDSSSI